MSDPTRLTKQGGYWSTTWNEPRKDGERRGRARMRRFGRVGKVTRTEAQRRYQRWLDKEYPNLKRAGEVNYSVDQLCHDFYAAMGKRYVVNGKHTTSITRIRTALDSFRSRYGLVEADEVSCGMVAVWLEGYIHERKTRRKELQGVYRHPSHQSSAGRGRDDEHVRIDAKRGDGKDDSANEAVSKLQRRSGGGTGDRAVPRTKETCNLALTIIKKMYRWASKYGKVTDASAGAVQLAENLRADHPELRRKDPIRPVAWETVQATKALCPPQVQALIEVLWLTGMRPGEALTLRPCDIEVVVQDRSNPIPAQGPTLRASDQRYTAVTGGGAASDNRAVLHVYTPRHHKTSHKGKVRKIVLGPRCWRIIEPLLPSRTDALVFEFPSWKNCGNFARYLRRRAERAGVEGWHPNQMRHSHATLVEEMFGAERAQAVLGHSNLAQQKVYVEKSLRQAAEVARRVG